MLYGLLVLRSDVRVGGESAPVHLPRFCCFVVAQIGTSRALGWSRRSLGLALGFWLGVGSSVTILLDWLA